MEVVSLRLMLPKSAWEARLESEDETGVRSSFLIDSRCRTEICQELLFHSLAEEASTAIPLRRPDNGVLSDWFLEASVEDIGKRVSAGWGASSVSVREWVTNLGACLEKRRLLARFVAVYTRFPNKKLRDVELARRVENLYLSAERGKRRALLGGYDSEEEADFTPDTPPEGKATGKARTPVDSVLHSLLIGLGDETPGGWSPLDAIVERESEDE